MKLYRVTLTKVLTVYVRAASSEDAWACASREQYQMFSDCYDGLPDIYADPRPVVDLKGLWDWDPQALVYGGLPSDPDITGEEAVKESAEEVEREKTAPLPFKEPTP